MAAVLSRNEASLHQAVTALCGNATSQRTVAHSFSGGWVEVDDSPHDIDYSKSHIPEYDEDEDEDDDDKDGIPLAPPTHRHKENPYDSNLGVFMGEPASAPVSAAVHQAPVHYAVQHVPAPQAHKPAQPSVHPVIPQVEESYDFASYEHPFGVPETHDSSGGDSGECEGSFKTMSRKEKQDFFSANYQSLQEDPSDQNFRSLFGKGRGRTPKWKDDFRDW
jgi:hypothetical protein